MACDKVFNSSAFNSRHSKKDELNIGVHQPSVIGSEYRFVIRLRQCNGIIRKKKTKKNKGHTQIKLKKKKKEKNIESPDIVRIQ